MREDWIEVELGEVCEIISGRNQKDVLNIEGKYPIYGSGGIFGRANSYLCEAGCTIIGRKGTINSPIFVNENFWNVDTAFGISPLIPVSKKIVYYFCLGFNFKALDKSTAIPSLAKTDIAKIKFPLAPLPIQRAIVSKIEALFSDLDNGIANFKKAKEQLKLYRQAVLKKAFEGYSKLTNVGDEFDFVGGGTPSKANSDYWNGELYWCSVKDVKGDCLHRTIDKITRKGLNESASNLVQPEEVILITRISPGKTIISKVETAINQDLKVVKPKREYLPKLIHYLFQAYQREIIKLSSGTTVLGINLTNLKSIEIPFLNSQEQTQIVQEIESRLSVTDNLEFVIRNSIEKAEALRQSILKKAFEGRLLNKAEIEQCKKEADYEPASELLKKIKAEKAERITNDKLRITKNKLKSKPRNS
jgi:type I restriction enzyme S subunit